MKTPSPLIPTDYRAWAIALAQGKSEVLAEVDPDQLDPLFDGYRYMLESFDRWHLEQQGQNPLRLDPPIHHRETRHARS